jgi:hypothetical protein
MDTPSRMSMSTAVSMRARLWLKVTSLWCHSVGDSSQPLSPRLAALKHALQAQLPSAYCQSSAYQKWGLSVKEHECQIRLQRASLPRSR